MFWNHGDSYIGSHCGKGDSTLFQNFRREYIAEQMYNKPSPQADYKKLPSKCMAIQNYRLVQLMCDQQQWILRNVLIWWKPNALPESVKDRFTRKYEPIFMLVKNKRYYFNLDGVRVPHKDIQDYQRHAPFNYRVREAKKKHFVHTVAKTTQLSGCSALSKQIR